MGSLGWVMGAGALGTGLRVIVAESVQARLEGGFPFGTLVVNVLGCLLIGALGAALEGSEAVSESTRRAVLLGLLGGFTTFSSFARDGLSLLEAGRLGEAVLYVMLSNGLGLLAVFCGARITG
jgi:fluoride exporter